MMRSTINKKSLNKINIIKLFFISIFSFLSNSEYGGSKNGFDLCITTHGNRFKFLGIALDSFAREGNEFIKNIYLTVDNEENINWFKLLIIKKLKKKGCKVIRGNASGPHSKYIYYLQQKWDFESSFFMIDDDVIYDPDLVKKLFFESKNYKHSICARGYQLALYKNKLRAYSTWNILTIAVEGYRVFPTNVGGSVIKKEFSKLLLKYYDKALKDSPSNDDIWFHWLSVKYQKPFKKVLNQHGNPSIIPFSQTESLTDINSTLNDLVIKKMYTKDILNKLRLEPQST